MSQLYFITDIYQGRAITSVHHRGYLGTDAIAMDHDGVTYWFTDCAAKFVSTALSCEDGIPSLAIKATLENTAHILKELDKARELELTGMYWVGMVTIKLSRAWVEAVYDKLLDEYTLAKLSDAIGSPEGNIIEALRKLIDDLRDQISNDDVKAVGTDRAIQALTLLSDAGYKTVSKR